MDFGNNRDSGRGDNFGGLPKPVKVGDEVELTIEAVGAKGDGIAKIEGFVIFVPDCQQGETVKVRITDVRGKSAVGERVDASSASSAPAEASVQEAPSEEVATETAATEEIVATEAAPAEDASVKKAPADEIAPKEQAVEMTAEDSEKKSAEVTE